MGEDSSKIRAAGQPAGTRKVPRRSALEALVRCRSLSIEWRIVRRAIQSVFFEKTPEYLSGNYHAPVSIPFPLVVILPQFAFQELSS
jgi:hypothetical protein